MASILAGRREASAARLASPRLVALTSTERALVASVAQIERVEVLDLSAVPAVANPHAGAVELFRPLP